jgi:5,5'-dehydrodivanillate O-demethylase oxygenase subunit
VAGAKGSVQNRRIKNDYRAFAHTGPGTLAGRYLRSYWQPVYRVQDLAPGRALPIQVMSEPLTLYRGEDGTPHLIAGRCAHRGTLLSTGEVEGDCIRCHYHGWLYAASGQCVEQPGEHPAFAKKVKIRGYPVQEYLGLIFAYLGEGEPPPLRRHPDLEREGVLKVGIPEYWPCNFFNRCENGLDSRHVSFAHRESARRSKRTDMLIIRDVSVEETEYGIRTSKVLPTERGLGKPTETVHFHMPNTTQVRVPGRVEGSLQDAAMLYVDRLLWYVPVDDERCVTFVVDLVPLTGDAAREYQDRIRQGQPPDPEMLNEIGERILRGQLRVRDVDPNLSTYFLFWIEDYISNIGQGVVADRSAERLGRADVGIILMRKLWERELRALDEGRPLTPWTTPAGLADETEWRPPVPSTVS